MPTKEVKETGNSEAPSAFDCGAEITDGGLHAWSTVIGAWLVQFATFGYTNAFGVYQDFYVREYLSDHSSSQISWIGSIQVMLLFSVGLVSGALFDKGYFRYLMMGGTVLFAFSLFMLSLTKPHQYYQVLLSQGLGSGIAFGMMFVPATSILSLHFSTRRPMAMGIVTSGSSLGGVLHPIMLNRLFHGSIGFHTGVRISATLLLTLLVIASLLMRTKVKTNNPVDASQNLRSFGRDPPYVFMVAGCFVVLAGVMVPFYFLQLDAVTNGVNTNLAFYMLAILNSCSLVGRLASSFLARRLGVFNLVIPCTAICGIVSFGFSVARKSHVLIVLAVLFGIFSGAYISLLAPMVATLSRDVTEIGARVGVCFFFIGFAALIGSPIAGALLSTHFIWWRPFVFSGTCLMIGSVLLLVSRAFLVVRKGTQKV